MSIFFYLWVLSLPFYQFNVIGTLSVDNIVGPFLIFLWLATSFLGRMSQARNRNLLVILGIVLFYFLSILISFTLSGTLSQIVGIIWQELKLILYLILPMLYIRTTQSYNTVLRLFVVNAVVVSAVAFAQSIGLIDLEFSRSFGGSRYELEGITRSPGLLGNYGDVAILLSLTVLVIYGCWEDLHWRILNSRIIRYGIYCVIAFGVFASQSRNVVLSILVAVISYYIFNKLKKRKSINVAPLIAITLILFVPLLLLTYYLIPHLYTILLGEGGVKESVLDRFVQYEIALKYISENILFGLGSSVYGKHEDLVRTIHNLWLGVALKGGLFAVVPILLLYYKIFTNAVIQMRNENFKNEPAVVAASSVAMVIASLFYVAQDAYIFWALMGLYLSLNTLADTRVRQKKAELR